MSGRAHDRSLPPQCRPQLARKVRLQKDKLTGEPVLLFPESVLLLNPTGAAIVELCDGRRTLAELISTLAARFGASPEVVSRDVVEYVTRLSGRGLLKLLVEPEVMS